MRPRICRLRVPVGLALCPLLVMTAICLGAPPSGAALQQFPTWGVALAGPPGWRQLPPDRYDLMTRWVSTDQKTGDVAAMIMVQGGKPQQGDAPASARKLADDWGGRVTNEHDTLGGQRAWRVQADPPASGLHPVEGVVTVHEGHLYMILGGVTPGLSCHEQIESIRKSWKWTAIESPTKHLDKLLDQPMLALGGSVRINFPAVMHTYQTDKPDQVLDLGLYNLQRNGPDFLAYVQIADLPKGDTIEAAKDRLAAGTREKLKLPEPFVWRNLKAPTSRAITQPVRDPSEKEPTYLAWGIIALDTGRVVLINFTINCEDRGERSAYEAAAAKIVESVSPAPVDQDGKGPQKEQAAGDPEPGRVPAPVSRP